MHANLTDSFALKNICTYYGRGGGFLHIDGARDQADSEHGLGGRAGCSATQQHWDGAGESLSIQIVQRA